MTRVLVAHPWLPDYRVPFFEKLVPALAAHDVELAIAHGEPESGVRDRGGQARQTWAAPLRTRERQVLGRRVVWRQLPDLGTFDAVILEQAAGNLESYMPLLSQRRRSAPRAALWGHGKTYTHAVRTLDAKVKRLMTNRAHWFFSYTEGGANNVCADGFPLDRVTLLNNTIDQTTLIEAMSTVTERDLARLRVEHRLTEGPIALYIGGVDPPKRIEFLLEAAALVAARIPGFQLLVAGSGSDANHVQELARQVDYVRYVGRATGHFKAVLASAAELLMVPGAIGLVAVDSFAMGLPIVTTSWPYHGPEFEYLRHGENAWIAESSVEAYADEVGLLLSDQDLRGRLAQGCRDSAPQYTLDSMVENFTRGVIAALEAPPR